MKSWSRTQGSLAASSGEAEFYAMLKGAAEGLGFKSLLADLGQEVTVEVITDSSAAKGTASRMGIGKMKHLDVGWLWLQELVRKGKIIPRKVNGKVNPADLLTKPKSAAEAVRLSAAVGFGLVIRKWANDTFCGFLNRATRGDRREPEEKAATMNWWFQHQRCRLDPGRT